VSIVANSAATPRTTTQVRVRRLLYFAARRVARALPASRRRKTINLFADSLPIGDWARLGVSNMSDVDVVRTFTRVLADSRGDRALELARGVLEQGLPPQSRLALRWDLAVRDEFTYRQGRVQLVAGSPLELGTASVIEQEPWAARWIEEYMAPAHVFYDIGAGVGVFALLAARLLGPTARVYAFEPAFMNFESLCRNVIANGLGSIVTPVPLALGSRSGIQPLHYSSIFAGADLQTLGAALDARNEPFTARCSQPTVTAALDDLVPTYKLAMPNHIRIAVNGSETAVLEGARDTLEDPRLLSLLIETWPGRTTLEAIERHLVPRGFRRAFRHDKMAPATNTPLLAHLLFVREA
jgi:FkbM family methyltransferase